MKDTYAIPKIVKYSVLSAALLLVGCVDEGDDEKKVEATYSSLWANVFSGCGVSCHSPNATNGTEDGPDFSTKQNFYSGLYEKDVTTYYPSWLKNADCDGQNLIDPGSANTSTLAGAMILSVSDSLNANFSCSSAYTVHAASNNTISDKETADALIAWINNGADNN